MLSKEILVFLIATFCANVVAKQPTASPTYYENRGSYNENRTKCSAFRGNGDRVKAGTFNLFQDCWIWACPLDTIHLNSCSHENNRLAKCTGDPVAALFDPNGQQVIAIDNDLHLTTEKYGLLRCPSNPSCPQAEFVIPKTGVSCGYYNMKGGCYGGKGHCAAQLDVVVVRHGADAWSPTQKPTAGIPTGSPVFPTFEPTTQPTLDPSFRPTRKPSGKPTSIPTLRPSKRPTVPPTHVPTTNPSKRPSTAPSTFPTVPSYNETTNQMGVCDHFDGTGDGFTEGDVNYGKYPSVCGITLCQNDVVHINGCPPFSDEKHPNPYKFPNSPIICLGDPVIGLFNSVGSMVAQGDDNKHCLKDEGGPYEFCPGLDFKYTGTECASFQVKGGCYGSRGACVGQFAFEVERYEKPDGGPLVVHGEKYEKKDPVPKRKDVNPNGVAIPIPGEEMGLFGPLQYYE